MFLASGDVVLHAVTSDANKSATAFTRLKNLIVLYAEEQFKI